MFSVPTNRDAVQIVMVRPTLDAFPRHPLPHPFTIRWYRAGDEHFWLEMKARSDTFHTADHSYYQQTYGTHADLLPQRQAFLCNEEDQPIGSATAWFEEFNHQQYGKVNWVFIVPEAQGCGLAKPLVSVIGERLQLLGHTQALLYTLVGRLVAIHLYQQFGFVPYIRSTDDQQAWEEVNQQLRVPFTAQQYIDGRYEKRPSE